MFIIRGYFYLIRLELYKMLEDELIIEELLKYIIIIESGIY